ncbi:hypothetical protein [Streptomyces sp. NPDC088736]|uniref:hypothetical protein n=1 Tax=Streptomyces sp. NPDC088736 TaxID=3365881 RepID=UPI00381FEC8D
MGGSEIESYALEAISGLDRKTRRRAAIRVADQFGKENPDPRDDLMPKLAGRDLGRDSVIAAGYLELLDQLGLKPEQIRRRP